MYKEIKNNPMIPNEEKKIFANMMNENPARPPPAQQPMVNLQVYQPPRPPPPPKKLDPMTYVPYYMPNPFNPAQFTQYMQQTFQPPMVKEYNITLNGFNGDHLRAGMIYEDILPSTISLGTAKTLGERVTIYEFIRSVMFSKGDGEDINVDSDGHDSILSHLKFMDLNPYNSYKFSLNPYKGLPFGFLLYRSCYPIRQNVMTKSDVICARDSTGVNVRVYQVTEGAYAINKLLNNSKQYNDYDVWREMAFYEYVREYVVKPKICPNFVLMYGYHLPTKCGINFNDIENVKDIKKEYSSLPPIARDQHDKNVSIYNDARLSLELMKNGQVLPNKLSSGNGNKPMPTMGLPNPDSYTGKALIALTEAPNYNIFGWASKIYARVGNVKRMKNTGFHPKEVWFGVLFQLMVALYVMQIHGIVIKDFSMDKNVFIKDLSLSGNVTSYWKYIINGIEYYIPNHGYLLMIDSNFRELNASETNKFLNNNLAPAPPTAPPTAPPLVPLIAPTIQLGKDVNKGTSLDTRKLRGTIFSDKEYTAEKIKEDTFHIFKSVMNDNVFGSDFINHGGTSLPDGVSALLNRINKECLSDTDHDIGKYFIGHMGMFMNNRIGTLLKESEVSSVQTGIVADMKCGDIVTYKDKYGAQRFCMFISTNTGKCLIMTRTTHNSGDMQKEEIPNGNIGGYSKANPIIQTFKINESNLNEEDLLETYAIYAN